MMSRNSSGFTPILVILIIGILSLVGLFLLKNNTPRIYPKPTPTPDTISNWKEYDAKSLNVSFKYPPDWFIEDGGTSQFPNVRIQNYDPKTAPQRGYAPEADKGKYLLIVNRYSAGASNGFYSAGDFIESLQKEGDEARFQGDLAGTVHIIEQKTDTINGFPAVWRKSNNTMYPKMINLAVYILDKKGNAIVIYDGLDTEGGKEIRNQIISTFKFTEEFSSSSTPFSAKTLNYKLPAGWQTTTNQSQDFEVGFNPQTMKADSGGNTSIWITAQRPNSSLGYLTYATISLHSYGGGSRHNFIYDQLGYTAEIAKSERTSSYAEKNYNYNGWSCLVLYGLGFSASGTTWGMCPISSTQALFIEGPGSISDTETLIQTIKILK